MLQRKPKVLVAMSGGVDSSVAAALLLREGYEVVGCFMRLGSPGESFDELIEDEPVARRSASCSVDRKSNDATVDAQRGSTKKTIRIGHQGCCSINDAADARMVAAHLGIPFYICNFKKDFGRIIDYFVGEYNAGRTPNPCVRCNDWLKFGKLHDYAKQIDADFVASGHYARVQWGGSEASRDGGIEGATGQEIEGSRDQHGVPTTDLKSQISDPQTQGSGLKTQNSVPRLLRGVDHSKDQSYVLFGAPRERLAEMLLPIGGLQKTRVREIARELGLPVFDKPDSQEICFVPDNDYAGLVARHSPDTVKPGTIVDSAGRIIGQHPGHQHFTIGQRKGVGVALGHPVYVVAKDPVANTVTVGEREELRVDAVTARETNWLTDEPPVGEWCGCTAKFRYNTLPTAARVRRTAGDEIEVCFDSPQYGVAAGQAVVCYDDDVVVCGGWIADAG